jgi:hypothetical protein
MPQWRHSNGQIRVWLLNLDQAERLERRKLVRLILLQPLVMLLSILFLYS